MIYHLEADSIQLNFGERKILSDVYIQVETGKITGLLGRNGQGKSSLMNILHGSLEPVSKSIRFDEVTFPFPYKKPGLINYLPQFNFIPAFLSLKAVFQAFEIEFSTFERLFSEFGSKYKAPLKELSGGQCRLVEVYAIIKAKTQFALLDEPFSYLMPLYVEKVKEIILEEKQTKGFLITDHIYREIISISDKMYLLNNGKTYLVNSIGDIERLGYARI